MDELKKKVGAMLTRLKEEKPLVHCISNYVTINDCANILLAIGAKPIMADAIDEVGEIECQCSALVINIGMISYEKIESIIEAGKIANKVGIPIILDPVGINVSRFRKNAAIKMLKKLNITAIRGNASEIRCLCGLKTQSKGVDSFETMSEDESKEIIITVSKKYKCIVAMTGMVDYITDGKRIVRISNGNKMMSYVSGTGCMTSALIGGFLGSCDDYFLSVVAGIMIMGIIGEKALDMLKENEGSGTYKVKIIDAAFNLKAFEIMERGQVYEE